MAKKSARRAAVRKAPAREIKLVTSVLAADDQVHLIAVCDDGTVWGKLMTDTEWKRDPAHETFDESSGEQNA